jgi:hypothetical protein
VRRGSDEGAAWLREGTLTHRLAVGRPEFKSRLGTPGRCLPLSCSAMMEREEPRRMFMGVRMWECMYCMYERKTNKVKKRVALGHQTFNTPLVSLSAFLLCGSAMHYSTAVSPFLPVLF